MDVAMATSSGGGDGRMPPTDLDQDGTTAQLDTSTAVAVDHGNVGPHTWPPMSLLPTEIIERVLLYTILPKHDQVAKVKSRDDVFCAMVRLHNAVPLCHVSRLFNSLSQPQMYRQILVPHRRLSKLLRSLRANPALVKHVRDACLDSHIWTSDVNDEVIAQLCMVIRLHCIKMRVGANESTLLPFLLHGSYKDVADGVGVPAAVQVLHICWRDEEEYDPNRIRSDEQLFEQVMMADTGETTAVGARQTLVALFEHTAFLPPSLSFLPAHATPHAEPPFAMDGICMYGNLHHLTLDVCSQGQVDQLFLESGYFVRKILPLLTFLRLELPISVLQCSTTRRGALAPRWPCTRFMFTPPEQADHTAASQHRRLADIIDEVANRNRKAELVAHGRTNGTPLAPCMGELLRSLLTRFALNVHRNDATLFELLLGGTKSAENIWSTRATIVASILSQSLQRQLAYGSTGYSSARPTNESHNGHAAGPDDDRCGTAKLEDTYVVFPSDKVESEGGVELYWNARWAEAQKEKEKHLPVLLGGTYQGRSTRYRSDRNEDGEDNGDDDGDGAMSQAVVDLNAPSDIHVSLMLRWPNALDAFFRFAAMV